MKNKKGYPDPTAGEEKTMTKNDAYKTFRCYHCVYCDDDNGVCLASDLESDDCPRYTDESEEVEP